MSYAPSILIGQLDSVHYIPPVHNRNFNHNSNGDRYQAVYLSTPSSTPITVSISDGQGSLLKSLIVSNTNDAVFDLNDFYGDNNGVYSASLDDNNLSNNNTVLSVTQDSLNIPLSRSGIILRSADLFYANFRLKTGSQAASLTAKGQPAQGRDFYIGANPNNSQPSRDKTNIFASFMATEDNTTVTIDGFPDTTVFHDATANFSSLPITFTLNAGQAYVISTYTDENIASNTVNGLIGSHVVSDKPIVMNTGNLLHGALNVNGQARDMGMDQSVPTDWLGNQYAFFRGNQNDDNLETPIIIAIDNNTDIIINGVLDTTINSGEYLQIHGSNYSADGTMLVETSSRAYAYQQLFGSTTRYSSGLNFIPPLGCFLPTSTDFLPQIDQLHPVVDHDLTTTITVITYEGSDVRVYDPVSPTPILTLTAAADALAIPGTTEWIAYEITGQQDNIRIESDGPVATGIFGFSGANGIAGYYTGFGGKASLRQVNLQSEISGTCTPIYQLENVPFEADEINWVRLSDNRVISRDSLVDVMFSGDYLAVVPNGTCADSIPFTVSCVQVSCDDYDLDGINDISDLDADDDGILDSIECPLIYPIEDQSFDSASDWNTTGWSVSGGQAITTQTNTSNQELSQSITGLADACSDFITMTIYVASSGYLNQINSADTALLEVSLFGEPLISITNPSGDSHAIIKLTGDSVKSDVTVFPISDAGAIEFFPIVLYLNWNNYPSSGDLLISHTGEGDMFYLDDIEIEYYNCDASVDRDGDGIPNCLDLDSDNDGIPDHVEACGSLFSGPVSYIDTPEGCSSGLIDGKYCDPLDSDGDGIPNFIDLDSDNDGIWDGIEAGHNDSIDVDGRIYGSATGSGPNGLFDLIEISPESDTINYVISNSEAIPDGIFDAYEIDSDGDTCHDTYEVEHSDDDRDGIVGSGSPSVDADGRVVSHAYAFPALSDRWQDADINHCLLCGTAVTNPHIFYYRKK